MFISKEIIYAFDDFRLDPNTRVLECNGSQLKTEPKVFGLILILIRHRHRIVSKQELAESLWPSNTVVSDTMLSRCAYQARKALSSNKHPDQYIKTQHGRGFRFVGVGPVEEIHAYNGKWNEVFKNGYPEKVRPLTSQQSILKTNSRTILPRLGLSLNQLKESESTVLFDDSVLELIAGEFDKLEDIEICPLRLGDLNKSGAIHSKLFKKEKITHLLTGETTQSTSSSSVFLRLCLYEVSKDKVHRIPIGFYELSYLQENRDKLLLATYRKAVITQVAQRVAASIGVLPKYTGGTENPGAYQLYLEAKDLLSENTVREGQIAQVLLEKAINFAPEFAEAWTELSWAYYEKVWAEGNGLKWVDLALEAVDKALSVEPDCVFANYTKVIYQTELGYTEAALTLARKCVDQSPNLGEYWYALSYVLRYLGATKESQRALEKSIAANPLFLAEIGDPPTGYIYSGEWLKFLQTTPAWDSPYFCYYRGYVMWELGRKKQALFELERGIKDDPKDNFSRLARALIYIINKEFKLANTVLTKLVKQRDLLSPGDSEFTYKEAKLLMLAGNYDLAMNRLQKSREGGFNCVTYCRLDPSFRPIYRHKRFMSMLQLSKKFA